MNTSTPETITTTPENKPRPVVIQRPLVTSQEDEHGVHLKLALPGVRKEDLRISLNDANLQISAPRHDEVPADWKAHRDAGDPVRYELNARLTSRLDGGKIHAALEDGVLSLHIPLREEAKPREIAIH